MKRLFEIDLNSYQILLNKEFIYLIPEFKIILDSDKSVNKNKAITIFTFIYFLIDFTSPLENLDYEQRYKDAISNSGISEDTAKEKKVINCILKYKELQNNATPSLKTLESIKKGFSSLDLYFKDINFTDRDKNGKLIHSPKDYISNIQEVNNIYEEINKLETRIFNEIKQHFGIRGAANLGDREINISNFVEWKEGLEPENNVKAKTIDYVTESNIRTETKSKYREV